MKISFGNSLLPPVLTLFHPQGPKISIVTCKNYLVKSNLDVCKHIEDFTHTSVETM